MSLVSELLELSDNDKNIVKTFKSKETLSSDIYNEKNGDFQIKEEIRDQLLVISNEFIEFVGIGFFVYDIILTGSLANYNWSEYSDVDLHILIDMVDFTDGELGMEAIVKELFDSKKNLWNENHEIKIKNFDVEIYVQDINEDHVSSGVYSILYNEWVIVPEQSNPNINEKKIIEKTELFCKKIDSVLGLDISDKKTIMSRIDDIRKKLKDFRQSGLESGGEYSYENLTFKLLRRNGYIGKLLDFKNHVYDKNLTMNQ